MYKFQNYPSPLLLFQLPISFYIKKQKNFEVRKMTVKLDEANDPTEIKVKYKIMRILETST